MIHEARAAALVSYDPNCRPNIVADRALGRRRAEDFAQASHVVKASDEDLEWLYPDRHWRDSADNWLSMGPAMVVVTRGPHGSFASNQSCWAEMTVAASLPPIVDTVGAGDSFMAAILWHLQSSSLLAPQSVIELNSDELSALLRVAGHAAGLTCSRSGANPPSRDELMGRTTELTSGPVWRCHGTPVARVSDRSRVGANRESPRCRYCGRRSARTRQLGRHVLGCGEQQRSQTCAIASKVCAIAPDVAN
jgi:hypothetical protein